MTGAVKGTCAITGATGFLGNYLAEKMKESGWTIRRLQRKREQVKKTDDDIVCFSIGEKLNPDCLANVDLLIHCGYDFNCTSWQQINETNGTGTKRIAQGIYRAITKGKDEVYLPWIWWPIMMIVKAIPETIFKRCRM